MRLSKFFQVVLIVFNVVLLIFLINSLVRRYVPLNQPLYWIGVAVEIGIAWLAYYFWMRSVLVKGFGRDRLISIVLLIAGLGLPNLYNIPGLDFLSPAGPSDLVFYWAVISLILYSHFTLDKYLAAHRRRRR